MRKTGENKNTFLGTKVLVLEGYARQSLPLVKAFSELGCEVSVLCSSVLDVSYVSRFPNKRILGVCSTRRELETEEYICKLIRTGHYDVVVPSVDFSAKILSKNKDELSKYSRIVSNDYPVFQLAEDKNLTMAICEKKRIPCPTTLQHASSLQEIQETSLAFPIVAKPRISYGAIGFRLLNSYEQADGFFDKRNGVILEDYVIQEYIPQTDIQYECAMFIDNKNQVKTAFVFSKNRWFPIGGGSSTMNISVNRPDIVTSCSKLLKEINWRGPADIDLIQDPRDQKAKVLEINPRVSGSVKLCFVSGVNLALQMLELAFDKEVSSFLEYSIGNRLRCIQTDMLWFFKSPNRFKAKPSWFDFRRTSDMTFSLSDPLTGMAYTLNGIIKYKEEMSKRK